MPAFRFEKLIISINTYHYNITTYNGRKIKDIK